MASYTAHRNLRLKDFLHPLSYELADLGIEGENRRAGPPRLAQVSWRDPSAKKGALPIPDDYNAFIAHTVKVYGAMAAQLDSDAIGRVAEAIFAAATDGAADRLRYMPNEDIRSVLTARRALSEPRLHRV